MVTYVSSSPLVANASPTGTQTASDIAALASGGYVVTWVDGPPFGAGSVYARVYDANGNPTTREILVGAGGQSSVTALPNGGFAVALTQGSVGSSTGSGISMRSFNAGGVAQTDLVSLARAPEGTPTPSSVGLPEITALADGRLIAAWQSNGGDGGSSKIVGTILSSHGRVLSAPLHLGTASQGSFGFSEISLSPLNNGGFAVASEEHTRSSIERLGKIRPYGKTYYQLFDSSGSTSSSVSILSEGELTPVSAATLIDGRVAVGYRNGFNFVFRLVSADGTVGSEQTIGASARVGFTSRPDVVGDLNLSSTTDGNILAHYDKDVTPSTSFFGISSEVSELISPTGAKLNSVSSLNPATLSGSSRISSQLAVALMTGSVGTAQTVSVFGEDDVFTRVYQPAASTIDPDGAPLVNDAFYNAHYPDVAAAGIDPEHHYATAGWIEGRDPNPLFSTAGYRSANVDVARASVDPLQHYDSSGWREGRDPAIAFDTQFYLARNPDVAAAGVDPLAHYLQSGQAEGREIFPSIGRPGSVIHGSFDAEYYLLANPDVGEAARGQSGDVFETAYRHYSTSGWREGRNPNAYFDTNAYLAAYQDVKAANVDPLLHYDTAGWREGRDPSARFDTSSYLTAFPDVAAAGVDPLRHFLTAGALEGRPPFGDGTFD
ncbi:hypothetical protein GCM10007886_06240 [Methylobacterium gregans]|nr:hypothetical protein [Methylobacterium gregans]MDQ0520041.1 hypothetical protein [Methylobacterium gregans]GLS52441.1 hypothetical protein GCM10007886_06240 [Methylobacterium gregans]